jgi:hypothetical protein
MATNRPSSLRSEAGFSLMESLISTALLMVVSGIVLSGTMSLTQLNVTNLNRGDMFAGVRNASALIQQEVGQAGRISLQNPIQVLAAVAAGTAPVTVQVGFVGAAPAGVNPTTGMFVNEKVDVGTDDDKETVMITALTGTTITATFLKAHPANAPVAVYGGFANGVIPPAVAAGAIPAFPNGSTDTVLKLFGDITGDSDGYSQMQYIEYECDFANSRLMRNAMAFDAGAKTAPTVEQILVDNLVPNPGGTPCFTYQTRNTQGMLFVTGVAVTLTVQSRQRDPVTNQFQTESKALLNVSPRNVFNVWQTAGLNLLDRVQMTPFSVGSTLILPLAP